MASREEIAELLKTSSGAHIKDYDGQVVTVLSIKKKASPFEKGEISVDATILTAEGEEVEVYTTPNVATQLQQVEQHLPLELKVVSFPGQFNKIGYGLENPDE